MADFAQTASYTARLLWIDDQIASFGPHIEALQESGFDVIAVATADEALSTVRRGDSFDAILVDLKMPDADGIELLEELYSEFGDVKGTKIMVLSSFLYDPLIRRRLVDLNMNVALLEKTRAQTDEPMASFAERVRDALGHGDEPPLVRDQFIDWDETARAQDPFDISLEVYLDSPMVVRLQLDQRAQAATRTVRDGLAKQGVVWSLFCGSRTQPVRTARDVSEIPSDDQVFTLASGKGHPPYEFYERGEFEESTGIEPSHATGGIQSDAACPGAPDYPYFRIAVVQHREARFSINRSRDFHFDSGLDITAFDLEAALEIGLDVDNGKPTKFVQYAGVDHAFYAFTGEAHVDRENRGSLEVVLSGRAYPDWKATPFNRRCCDFDCAAGEFCHRRHALLGRNLLVENALHLDLRRIQGLPPS